MLGSRPIFLIAMLIGSCFALPRPGAAQEKQEKSESAKPGAEVDQAALEKDFREKLSGCVLRGHFSVVGRGADDKPPREEKYTITKASKLPSGLWLFESRMQYGKNDVTIPLPLKVVWAGDTPVITLTDLTIPGLGTFTARVMIYGDRYAGTWQHDKVGGHLWGTIEKAKDTDKPDTKSDTKEAPQKDAKPDSK